MATTTPTSTAPSETGPAPGARHRADRTRLLRLAADLVFAGLLLAILLLAGWHAARHDHYWDWTSQGRNSLAPESIAVLATLDAPLEITVYAPAEHRVSQAAAQLLARYRRHHPELMVTHVDPQRFPERARDANVELLGELVLAYGGRRETLRVLSESALTNAIARLVQPQRPWLAVLEGHGERAVEGTAGADLGRFAQLLHQRGFRLQPLDLARFGTVPDNVDLLLVSTPGIALFPGEAQALVDFLARGGNLLWLLDPGEDLRGLAPVAEYLGLRRLPGTVVDAAAADENLDAPTFAIVREWGDHPLTRGLERSAILAGAVALDLDPLSDWRLATALRTGPESWNETGPVRGEVTRNAGAGEQPGPLAVALALTRPREDAADATDATDPPRNDGAIAAGDTAPAAPSLPTEQRVIIVGDGDFASNAHLGNGVNQALALRMARWLTGQEELVAIAPHSSDRDTLELAPVRGWLIVGIGLMGLPALLALAGLLIHWRRARA